MSGQTLKLTYESSLDNLCKANSSFDSGVLKIAYVGFNRNSTHISKEAFEDSLNTIYNCPIVTAYYRDTDTLGGHDIEIVSTDEDEYEIINATHPVGVIPESSSVWWENVEEEDGTTNEYLCADVLIWKRQEAYKKIKSDGITSQSMEIDVLDGETIDGVFYIKKFEFTAFALIGVEPCFESASVSFSVADIKAQLEEMMDDLKQSYNLISAQNGNGNTSFQEEGGEAELNNTEQDKVNGVIEDANQATDEPKAQDFALISNITEEVMKALHSCKTHSEYGDLTLYFFQDLDIDKNEVYAWDTEDWMLYGFSYSMDGDVVIIDFESKKRVKFVIEDFDEGEHLTGNQAPFAEVYSNMSEKFKADAEKISKYETDLSELGDFQEELKELRKYKKSIEDEIISTQKEEVFKSFEELDGVEEFELLKDNCDELLPESIEEKCYAIKGRHISSTNFSISKKTPKIKVPRELDDKAEYDGIFEKYGYTTKKQTK